MSNSVKQFSKINFNATPADIDIQKPGQYLFILNATWGGGNVQLKRLSLDQATFVPVAAAVTADGVQTVYLPTGTYRIVVTTATAITYELISIDTYL